MIINSRLFTSFWELKDFPDVKMQKKYSNCDSHLKHGDDFIFPWCQKLQRKTTTLLKFYSFMNQMKHNISLHACRSLQKGLTKFGKRTSC